MIVLIDMDEVITNFEAGIVREWEKRHPGVELFPNGHRDHFYIGNGQGKDTALEVTQIIHQAGFFEGLDPIHGSIQAVSDIKELGHTVFIVTSPGISYPNAASEKYRWIEKHFGKHMLEWLVITPAKPIVRGDILIDDRPELYYEEWATWEHVLYDHLYNQDVEGKRRLTWENWREVLPELL